MMTRFHLHSVLAVSATTACCALLLNAPRTASAADNKVEFPAPSSHSVVQQRIGITDVEVDYSRPNKGGREIFGKLVPYNTVWRTGANSSTKISFSTAVNIAGKVIPAGKYGLYTIPNPGEWTIIFYEDPNQWGAYDYKQSKDVARITAKSGDLPAPLETFTISFNDVKESSANLVFAWDQTRVSVPLGVDTVTKVTSQINRVAGTPDATPQFYAQAANYYLSHDLELPTALKWINLAIQATPDAYAYYGRKAVILNKLGDKGTAIATAEKAIAIAKAHAPADDPDAVDSLTKLLDSIR